MSQFECFSFFCEDVRWESNGSPMFIGVMTPVFHPESYPIKFSSIELVTIFRADHQFVEIETDLILKKFSSGNEEIVGRYGSKFNSESGEPEGMQWTAISTLPLRDIEFLQGDYLLAEIEVGGARQSVSFFAGSPLE